MSGNDLLSYWYDDPATRAVALYLESLGNPRRFARIARAIGRRKPVLVVKSGRTAAGSRAGASHTAAAAAPDATVDALFAQAGVIRCDGLGELLDAARLLVDQPLPAGPRLGIIGNAGGINVLATDDAGPGRAEGTRTARRPTDPARRTRTGRRHRRQPDRPRRGHHPRRRSPPPSVPSPPAAPSTPSWSRSPPPSPTTYPPSSPRSPTPPTPSTCPVAVVLLGVPEPPTSLGTRHAPVYPLPEQAVTALGHAARYAAWRRTPLGSRPDLPGIDENAARRLVREARSPGGGWQPPALAADLLVPLRHPDRRRHRRVHADDAVAAAATLGFPVVLKAADPDLVHKSDIGGVRLNLTDADAVRTAYHADRRRARRRRTRRYSCSDSCRRRGTRRRHRARPAVRLPGHARPRRRAHRPVRRPRAAAAAPDRHRRGQHVARPTRRPTAHRVPRRAARRHRRRRRPAAAPRPTRRRPARSRRTRPQPGPRRPGRRRRRRRQAPPRRGRHRTRPVHALAARTGLTRRRVRTRRTAATVVAGGDGSKVPPRGSFRPCPTRTAGASLKLMREANSPIPSPVPVHHVLTGGTP